MADLGYNPGKSFDGVDPKLADIMKLAIASYDDPNISKINIKSGKRVGDKRQHGKGNAIDITLFDKNGKQIPDYQSSDNFGFYESFAKHVRDVQKNLYPDLSKDLRWGGYFSGDIGKGGKYGAMDLMHFDLAGSHIGMAAGNFEDGLKDQWKKAWGISSDAIHKAGESVGLVDAAGGSSTVPTGLNKPQLGVFDQVSSLLDQEKWSPGAKAAILASISRESGFDPNATNNKGERSFGLFQWNGDRQDAMRAWAKDQGLDPTSVEAQVGFFHHELNTTEKAAGAALRSAGDVAGANAGMRKFERYGGGDAEEQARLQTAQQFLGGDYSAVRPARLAVQGTPAEPSLDPSAMQLALKDAGIKDTWGSDLKVDGLIGPRTMTARDSALGVAKTLSPESPPEQITAVQASLNSLGARGLDGNALAVDGKYGPDTEYAISQLRAINRPTSPRMADDGTIKPQWTIADKTKNPITNLSGVVSDIGDGIKDIFVNEDGDSRLIEGLKSIFSHDDSVPQKPLPQGFDKLTKAILPETVDVPQSKFSLPEQAPIPGNNPFRNGGGGIGSDASIPLNNPKLPGSGIGSDANKPMVEDLPRPQFDPIVGKHLRYIEDQDRRRDFINKSRIRQGQSELSGNKPNSGFGLQNLLKAIFS